MAKKKKKNAAQGFLKKLRVREAPEVEPKQSIYARLARFFRIRIAEEPKKAEENI